MGITQVKHPPHPRLPLRPRRLPQTPALIDRRHILIHWTQRPRPTTHAHHQQTPDPIINNTNTDQGLATQINTTVVVGTIDRGLAAQIHTTVVSGTNTSVSDSIIVNTIVADFDSIVAHTIVAHTIAADVAIDSNIADISVIDAGIPHSSIVGVVQDNAGSFTGACRQLCDPLARLPAANQHSDNGHSREQRRRPRNTDSVQVALRAPRRRAGR